ncbi:MAG: BglII/BstYI family type II restriction endonuclease [Planctomycetia bacterium]|nr:BglII/BstYI family type II restriction endonuclease [Planctomycetia bacterium]
MEIAGIYSFYHGEEIVREKYGKLLKEVETIIHRVDAEKCKTKESEEKTMPGRLLYAPRLLNSEFKKEFECIGWNSVQVPCEYSADYYVNGYTPKSLSGKPYREMDFVKDSLGVEVQFGKYAFMVYNVAAKMTIFRKLGYIQAGIEIVPVKELARDMSSGVSFFEQFVWDLEHRGISDIDTPVMILGIK